jgi:mono/diheme cytochrome c family protein
MKLAFEVKAVILGAISGFAALGIALAAGQVLQQSTSAASGASATSEIPPAGSLARQGYGLFQLNCAHCHGNDARGDEGPDLHVITKSDARISAIIRNGIKGEMPKFSAKLSDADIRALIAFTRSLK